MYTHLLQKRLPYIFSVVHFERLFPRRTLNIYEKRNPIQKDSKCMNSEFDAFLPRKATVYIQQKVGKIQIYIHIARRCHTRAPKTILFQALDFHTFGGSIFEACSIRKKCPV